jgi:hypothetical protein
VPAIRQKLHLSLCPNFRDPLSPYEAAASLARRDGISLDLSGALWLKYNLLAEHHSRCFPRAFVEYKNLLSNWRGEVSRISASLSIELNTSDGQEVDTFLDSKLRHHKHHNASPQTFSQPWIDDLYTAFSAAASGNKLDLPVIDKIFAEFDSVQLSPNIFNEYRLRFRSSYGKESGQTFLSLGRTA